MMDEICFLIIYMSIMIDDGVLGFFALDMDIIYPGWEGGFWFHFFFDIIFAYLYNIISRDIHYT